MPVVFVDKHRDLMSALRRLKRQCVDFLSKSPKKNDKYHTKKSTKRRNAKIAAKARERKRQQRSEVKRTRR
jgi:ribosomal protein S21